MVGDKLMAEMDGLGGLEVGVMADQDAPLEKSMLEPAQIEALEQRRCAAMIAKDIKALDTLLDASLIWIHGSARQDSKASFLAGFEGPVPKYLEIKRSDVVVRCFGDVAIVNGIQNMRCIMQGVEMDVVNRYVNVWAARDGGIKLVTWQSTPVLAT